MFEKYCRGGDPDFGVGMLIPQVIVWLEILGKLSEGKK
jgi:hypothetical protein